MDDRPRYMISVAAELVGMHPQTLRIYEQKGLVRPKRTPATRGSTRSATSSGCALIQRLTPSSGSTSRASSACSASRTSCAACARSSSGWSARCAPRSSRAQDSTGATSSSTAPAQPPAAGGALMDFNKLTIKTQEASPPRRSWRGARGNPELYPEHLLLALLDQELPRQLVPDRRALRAQAEAKLAPAPTVERRAPAAAGVAPRSRACSTAPRTRRGSSRTSTSRRAPAARARRRARASAARRRSRRCAAASA